MPDIMSGIMPSELLQKKQELLQKMCDHAAGFHLPGEVDTMTAEDFAVVVDGYSDMVDKREEWFNEIVKIDEELTSRGAQVLNDEIRVLLNLVIDANIRQESAVQNITARLTKELKSVRQGKTTNRAYQAALDATYEGNEYKL